jgi:neutral ceramidase
MSELLVGWSKREITIPAHYPLAGYIARQGGSTGQLDPLFVRALVLQQGKLSVGIIVADLLLISNRWAEHLRSRLAQRLNTRKDHMIVAATHTHSGPAVDTSPFNFSQASEAMLAEQSTMRSIGERMEQALAQAAGSLQPVEVTAARVLVRGVATDRNHLHRRRTQPFLLLRFSGATKPAVLGVYGCHPTVLGADNTLLSGDLHGEIQRCMERNVEVALVGNAAAANISTRFTRRDQTPSELLRLAESVVFAAKRARFRPLPFPRLSLLTKSIRLSVDTLRTPAPRQIRTGRLAVVDAEARTVCERLASAPEFAGGSITAPVTVLGIGHMTLAALPFELYSDTGEFLWKHGPIIPLCYANGYWGYVPSRAAGASDYESISSPFSRDADAKLRSEIISLAKT